jgi:hypothetical protein
MYRNVTDLGKGVRLSGVAMGDTNVALRPSLRYDPPVSTSSVVVNTLLVHYRPSATLEVAVGKDQLPTGINIPDLSAATKARNRYGYYDAPLQAKMFIGGKRYQVMPFVYGPGGNEVAGEREHGVGTLGEVDLLGTGRTVVGLSVLRGAADNGGRRVVGGYARLGFGAWGILAEHDVTDRTREGIVGGVTAGDSFRQHASYVQTFWAVREWLVTSIIGERLRVNQPFAERLAAARLEVAARLTNQAAVSISAGAQRNLLAHTWTRSVMAQVALKSAQ